MDRVVEGPPTATPFHTSQLLPSSLHKPQVLKQYFHLDQTQMIFGETVQQHYNTHLKQTFAAVPLADEGAVERLVNDIKNYKVNIERFGITVLPADDPEANTEENILKYFLPELNATP